jgi:hypothetical protein
MAEKVYTKEDIAEIASQASRIPRGKYNGSDYTVQVVGGDSHC